MECEKRTTGTCSDRADLFTVAPRGLKNYQPAVSSTAGAYLIVVNYSTLVAEIDKTGGSSVYIFDLFSRAIAGGYLFVLIAYQKTQPRFTRLTLCRTI